MTSVEGAAEAVRGLREGHGCAPDSVWQVPDRLDLLGGAVEGGAVLCCALPWGVTAAAARTGDGAAEASATLPAPGGPPGPPHTSVGARAWPTAAAAALEILRAERAVDDPRVGVRLHLHAAALRSAAPAAHAAMACGALLAVAEATGAARAVADPGDAARLSHRLAAVLPGAPTTVMDHRAVLGAAAGRALVVDARTGRGRALPLDAQTAGLELLVVEAETTHEGLALGEERRRECERAAHLLEVSCLSEVRDVEHALARLPEPVLRNRLRHAVPESHRVNAAAGLLRAGAVAEIGALLIASHHSQREYFADTDDLLDAAVRSAVRHGARGARTTGAAAGRRAVALVESARAEAVSDGIATAFCDGAAPLVRSAAPAPGAQRLTPQQVDDLR